MINIGDLLSNYSKIKNPLIEKKEVSNVLLSDFNLDIKENQIFFRKNVLLLKVSPVYKSFIFMKKNKILESVNKIVPERFIKTIQF